MKKILLFLILLSLSSCMFWSGIRRPDLAMMNYSIPEGTPKFRKGYGEGCETALYTRGNIAYRTKYSGHKFDPKFIDDSEYRFGFTRGYTYCFHMTVSGGHYTGAADTYIYGAGVPFDMGTGNINNTVNYGALNWMNIPDGGLNGSIDTLQKGRTGGGVFGAHPLWGTWQKNQLFGLGENAE